MRRAMILAASLLLPAAAVAQAVAPTVATEPLFDPVTGYRLAHYRGVVGPAPQGVERIDAARAHALWREGAIFIDVNPAPGAVRDPASGHWTLAAAHASIPRAHWFAEAGRGRLADGVERWFLGGVRRLAAAHPHRPLVIFCQADCWMSWNAALRLHRAGLRDIRWFADGLDGWTEAGFATVASMPQRWK